MGQPGAGGLRSAGADARCCHQPTLILSRGTGQSHLAARTSAREGSAPDGLRGDAADSGKCEDGPLMPCSGAHRIVVEEVEIVQMEMVLGGFGGDRRSGHWRTGDYYMWGTLPLGGPHLVGLQLQKRGVRGWKL
jgi:hypothetical protein